MNLEIKKTRKNKVSDTVTVRGVGCGIASSIIFPSQTMPIAPKDLSLQKFTKAHSESSLSLRIINTTCIFSRAIA